MTEYFLAQYCCRAVTQLAVSHSAAQRASLASVRLSLQSAASASKGRGEPGPRACVPKRPVRAPAKRGLQQDVARAMGVHGEATVTSGALAGVRVLLDEQAGGQGAARGAGGSVRAKVLSGEFAGSMRFLRFDKLRLDGDDEEAAARPATSSRALLKGEDAREGDQRPTAERVPAAQQDLPCVGGGSATAQRSKADKAVAAAIEAARTKQEARDAALREAERKAAAEEVEMQRKREENKVTDEASLRKDTHTLCCRLPLILSFPHTLSAIP